MCSTEPVGHVVRIDAGVGCGGAPYDPREKGALAVVDSEGLIGVFAGAAAATAALQKYMGFSPPLVAIPCLHGELWEPGSPIYVLPFRPTNNVAFVTKSAEKCKEVQDALCTIGLAYDEEDVACWRTPAGELTHHGRFRLEERLKMITGGPGVDAREKKALRLFMELTAPPPVPPDTVRLDLLAFVAPKLGPEPPPRGAEDAGGDGGGVGHGGGKIGEGGCRGSSADAGV